ncbi:MAG: FAD-dependent oxidoreductase [Myxococcota bacterium]
MPTRVPTAVWHAGRVVSVSAMLALAATLIAAPEVGLLLTWGVVVPLLPAVWMLAPGLWRNLCPLSAANQTPRIFGFTRGKTLPPALARWAYVIGIGLFLALASLRQVVFNASGPAAGALLLGLMGLAFAGGVAFKGKSGWCSTFCPLLPVQRLYGQTPAVVVPNSYCKPCVGCAKNCYDFNPTAAQLADLHDDDPRYRGYRKLFAALFPGFVFGFFHVPADAAPLERLGFLGLSVLASLGAFTALRAFTRLTLFKLTAVFAALAWTFFYWWGLPVVARSLATLFDASATPGAPGAIAAEAPEALIAALRALVVIAAGIWLVRTLRREPRFLARAAVTAPPKLRASMLASKHLAKVARGPEVTFEPEGRHVVARIDQAILEVAEASGLKIEAGCRMGVCGADPIAVLKGAEHVCPVGDDERATLERLGFATNTRMACMARVRGPVTVSLTPRRARESWSDGAARAGHDPKVKRLVIIGNGIAGVTAADFARRYAKDLEIHLVAREPVHLYNRMALSRVIYGKSALHGLYLQPESWYDEQRIQAALNTRATRIDRAAREVVLATGERLAYDRVILATGADALMPAVAGLDLKGAFALRDAADAVAIRGFVQEHGCRRVVVAGGGLLGLETAYALHKLGTHVTVLERGPNLMGRQLDARGGGVLERYLAGLGIDVLLRVELERASGDGRGRVVTADLKDGQVLACDLLCVCIGIRPNAQLAKDAGLAVGARGVTVDALLRTSDPDIFAAGDVADFPGQVGGLWPVGVEQAKLAAQNAVCLPDRHKAYAPQAPVTMLKVSGIDVLSLGVIEPAPDDLAVVPDDAEPRRYRKLVVRDGLVVGAIVIGHPDLAPSVTAAVKARRPVGALLARLRAGDWSGLADPR